MINCQSGDIEVGRQEGFERDRRPELSGADQFGGQLENALVNRLEEMFGLEKIRHAIKCLVIDEDRPKQRLLRLDVVRRCPDRGGEGRVHAAPPSRWTKLKFGGHSLSNIQPVCNCPPTRCCIVGRRLPFAR